MCSASFSPRNCLSRKEMRPLFTLPLPECLITSLAKSGYQYFEDLRKGSNDDCRAEAKGIIESFGLSWGDIKASSESPRSVSAAQLLREELFNEYIPTFSEAVDKILGGGVQTNSILQVCGPPGSGKTQMGIQLCINVQIPVSLGGLGAEAAFIDTEGTFSPKRIREMASAAVEHCQSIATMHKVKEDLDSFTVDNILSRVNYIAVANLTQLMASLRRLAELLQQNPNVKLVVIDSITFPFLKVTESLKRTRCISMVVQELQDLATSHSLAVVLNNHLTTKISQENKILAPALGDGFTHLIPTTMLLGVINNVFTAVMYKSNKHKEEVVNFKISGVGIRDN